MTFIKVNTLPAGVHETGNVVEALIFVGPGVMIVEAREKGQKADAAKLVFPDGRAIVLAHSIRYMESLLMGDIQRPGLVSDVDRQLGRTGKS